MSDVLVHVVRGAATLGSRVPGFFPLVVDPIHARIGRRGDAATCVLGVRLCLDLDEYTQRRIYYGCFESNELRFVSRFLRPGDVIFDVGAHTGLYSVVAAARVGDAGHVHAFEPIQENRARLIRNVRINDLTNVTVNPFAVGEQAGEVGIGRPFADEGTSGDFAVGGSHGSRAVRVLTLDAYVEQHDIPHLRLAKIDVEGYEAHILRGFANGLAASPPDAIVIEVNLPMLERHGSSGREVTTLLRDHGYSLYRPSPLGLRAVDCNRTLATLPSVSGSGTRNPLLAGLRERGQLFNLIALAPNEPRGRVRLRRRRPSGRS